jgi:transposase
MPYSDPKKQREYYQKNKEKNNAKLRERRKLKPLSKQDKEKNKIASLEYRRKNIDRLREYDRNRQKTNVKEYQQKYYQEVLKPKRQVKKLLNNN